MSSPQRMRMFGFFVSGISLSYQNLDLRSRFKGSISRPIAS